MKKLLSLVVFILGTFSFTFAFTQPQVGSNMSRQNASTFYTQSQCVDGETFYETYHYYLGDNFSMFDTHRGDADQYAYVYDTTSKVIVVDPYNVFHFNNDFKYKSNGKPVGVYEVIFVENSGYFKTGSLLSSLPNVNGGALVGQLVFNLHRRWFRNTWGMQSYTVNYFPYPNGPQQSSSFSKYHKGDDTDGYECFNYVVHYCGDGVVDTQASIAALPNGKVGSVANEQCDYNDPNHTNRGNGGCSNSCQPINTQNPQCNSTYNGQTQYTQNSNPWLNNTMNLCTIGTLSNFNYSGTPRLFTWNCSAGGNTVNCSANQQWCGDSQLNGNEQCDYNDPNHTNRGNGGCSNSCQPINIENPQCSSTYNNQTQYTSNGNNWLNQNMNLCTIGSVTNFQFSWNPGHSRHFTWNCTVGGNSTGCLAYQQWCGDGKVESNHGEACDPADPTQAGRGNGGCSDSCQPINVQNPQCNSQYNGQTQYTPNSNPWLNNTMNLCTIGTLSNFNYSGTPRLFTWNCSAGGNTINCSANQQWCGDSQLNGNEQCDYNDPTHAGWNGMQCDNSCHLYSPGSPVPYLLKEQKTGGMNNFTTNQINVEIGEIITYKVNFGNSGTVAATGEVRDILPPCVNYLTSSIHLPNGVTYNGPITGPYGNQYMVKYKDFRLQPGQGGYMLIQAQIRGTGTNGTTSCSNVTTYVNTGYFKFEGGNTLQSHVVAVRPQAPQLPHLTINKELITAGDMTAGSTVVYKITLTNDGNATYYNAYIWDILPNAIQYLTSDIQNVTNYLFEQGTTGNNEYYIKYYNFNLAAGHSAIVYLTGTLKQGFNFNQTTNCAITSGAIDCESFPLTPVPFIQKYQKIGNDTNPNSNNWTTEVLTVELGQYISYRIDFGNLGNKAATGEIRDILPNCVQYVSANLVGANGVGPTYYPNTHTVRFTNIPLAAGQTAHMMVVGKIKQEDGCQNVYSYLNTGEFHFINTPWQNSTVLAERPNTTDVEITKTVDKNKVKSGDIVTYTITYKNMGPEILQSYTIVDYWPSEQLDFTGVIEPTTPTPIWEGNNIIKWHFNTPLGVGEQRQIKIRGIVR